MRGGGDENVYFVFKLIFLIFTVPAFESLTSQCLAFVNRSGDRERVTSHLINHAYNCTHVTSSPNSSSPFQAVPARFYSLVSDLDEFICEIYVFKAKLEKIQVFWEVTQHRQVICPKCLELLHPVDIGTTIIRDVSNRSPVDTA